MKRLLCSLVLVLLTAPAFAGTVYIPYASGLELGGVTYETRVWATNNDFANASTIEYLAFPTFRDGTEREELEPTELTIPAAGTFIFTISGTRGMLEVFAPEHVQIDARMVATGGNPVGQGFDVPIVSSDNVVPAGQDAHLLGWERILAGEVAFTNFGLVNLGHDTANCLVDVVRTDGNQVVEDFPLTINPLSHNMWRHALGIVGVTDAYGWRAIVTCDQQFYTYSSIQYPLTSRMTFAGPAASGKSLLERPVGGGVSSEFDYMSDLPIHGWGGIEIRPFINRSGIDFHPPGGGSPIGGIVPIRINGVTYDKGLSFYPRWSVTPFVEYKLDGRYAQFTAVVRVDDFFNGRYEWGVVNSDCRFVRLERPPEGFRGPERSNPIRVGSAMTFQVRGDGEVLYQSPEVYAYGDPIMLEIDVRGVDVLRLQAHPDGTEQLGAPHRNGLSAPRKVCRAPWLDMIDFADPKLFYPR